MANTKVPIELSSTPGIVDNSTATAITIDGTGAATFSGTVTANGLTVDGSTTGSVAILVENTLASGDADSDINLKTASLGGELRISFDHPLATSPSFIQGSDQLIFAPNGTVAMSLDSSGNLLVGTTSSSGSKLYVSSNAGSATVGDFRNGSATGSGMYIAAGDTASQYALRVADYANNHLMTVDGSGNVGIGTSSPNVNLEILSGGTFTGAIRVGDSGSSRRLILEQTDVLTYTIGGTGTSSVTRFVSGGSSGIGTERMRIDSSGNLLVGKTASSAAIVGSELRSTGSVLSAMASASNGTITLGAYSTTANQWQFYVGMAGTPFARSGISLLSDERRKENIVDLETGLTEVMALRPRRFDWRNRQEGDDTQIAGFIAQEVEAVLPDLISSYADDEIDDLKSVRVGDILPTVVKAMQEQQAIIEALTARLEALEGA